MTNVLTPNVDRAPADAGHIAALDGIRALAILMVLGLHAGDFMPATRGGHAVLAVVGYGWIGVDLFFVISGMLITGILLETKARPGYYVSFYARRSLRIFPLYYAALFLLLVVRPVVHAWLSHHAPVFFPRQGWLWTYTTNLWIAAHESWDVMAPNTVPFWSLAVEEQFYLVWPFVVARLAPRTLARTALGMIVAALLLRIVFTVQGGHAWGVYVSTLTRMDALAAGALIAIAARAPGGLAPYRRYVAPVLVGGGLVLVALFAASGTNAHEAPLISTFGLTLTAGLSAAAIVAVLTAKPEARLRRALEGRWIRHLGARSYGVYVWHLAIYTWIIANVLGPMAVIVPSAFVRGLIGAVAAVAIALAVANVSWVLLERPFLALKRFVPRPVAATRPPPGVDARPTAATRRGPEVIETPVPL